ncbi:MAG: magnesium transporter [Bacteroidota bacterium]
MTETLERMEELLEQQEWKQLRAEVMEYEPVEIAEIIEDLEDQESVIVFRLLPKELSKDTFQNLSYEKQEHIITALAQNVHKITSLLNELDPDDRTALFEELPGEISQRLIQLLSPEERKVATKLLGYPVYSIGRLMTPEYVAVRPYYTVSEALEEIRKHGKDSETLNVVYVIDDKWKLIDDIRIREIILARPDQTIEEIMDNKFVALSAFDDQEMAIKVFKDHDRVALPVVDTDGLLIGIVTVDDVMDIVEMETTEDFHKFGSFQDAVVNPLKARIMLLYKNRIFWLTALVFMNIFSGAAIEHFQDTITSMVSLLFFLPLLIASSGNAGAQSATLMIRSLAVGDVEPKDWWKLFGREFLVSFLLGVTMAAGVSLIATFRAPDIIAVVAITMVLTVMAGSLLGLLMPFVFTKLNLDPATASAPLITSIADILGVVIYFSIATWLLAI